MLNWAARYYPILRTLREHDLLSRGEILEIGSGSRGLGTFRKVPFVGCDLSFLQPPQWPMRAVVASATDLPFENRSFDAVVASDVLEHIPPDSREQVIREALRVGRRLVIFGFPCGTAAHDADRALREVYLRRNVPVPSWLEEHMLAPFPDEHLFSNISDWKVSGFGNENLAFHAWMMRQEMHGPFVRASAAVCRLMPRLTEFFLRRTERPPYYRRIFVLTPASRN